MPLFGVSSPLRLLRETWRNPTMLAQELYAMFTAKEPVVREGPVEIRVGPGETGLKITQTAAGEPVASNALAANRFRQPEAARPEVQFERSATSPKFGDPLRPKPVVPDPPRSVLAEMAASFESRSPSAASQSASVQRKASPGSAEARRPLTTPTPAGQGGGTTDRSLSFQGRASLAQPLGPDAARAEAKAAPIEIPRAGAAPYESPVFSVNGPAQFTGRPVQFQQPPQVFDQATGAYQPLVPPAIPFTQLIEGKFGEVVGGQGSEWQVRVTHDLSGNTGDVIDVVALGVADDENAPPGMIVGPILLVESAGGPQYAIAPAVWLA